MKTKLFLITFLLFSFTFVNAQSTKDLTKVAKAETAKMVEALDLTDDQESLVFRQNYVLLDHQVRFDKVEDKTEEVLESMAHYKKVYIDNVSALLTDSQREAFTAWQKKAKMLK